MFGAFRASPVSQGGLLWKVPWRLSRTRKANQRDRLKKVDSVIEAVRASGVQCNALTEALQLPKEHEMAPRDKYTVFSPHSRGYRKGIHKVPKFTRVRLRGSRFLARTHSYADHPPGEPQGFLIIDHSYLYSCIVSGITSPLIIPALI
ncbi:hypothetical protein GLOTRDRAFT_36042 [Gloeophyllum trabeum ATCC 11539]|uniref:54S ribosomal protein L31, mitochondrial n=1 Tax=Gloeophyllum trabeum (strain ATCC 11539 / FP-39264 / Madison 617) TaxID=670483 RepID=S7RVB4_GLOTA|nr:uncharacterized protein GLOTRDRAFT_36042 [Gloeophyllum trabeum ATCC 11539]EPQ58720.1 hypothetical protein GLOTRDRAFT_36042 [Gloeophyllum trabeum ATCC 11539]